MQALEVELLGNLQKTAEHSQLKHHDKIGGGEVVDQSGLLQGTGAHKREGEHGEPASLKIEKVAVGEGVEIIDALPELRLSFGGFGAGAKHCFVGGADELATVVGEKPPAREAQDGGFTRGIERRYAALQIGRRNNVIVRGPFVVFAARHVE